MCINLCIIWGYLDQPNGAIGDMGISGYRVFGYLLASQEI
jgi:hypothetical protein